MHLRYSECLQELVSDDPRAQIAGALRFALPFLGTDSLAVTLYNISGKHHLLSQEGYPHEVARVFANELFYTMRREYIKNSGHSLSVIPTWEAVGWQSTPIAQLIMRSAGFYEGISLPIFNPQNHIVGYAHTNIRSRRWSPDLVRSFIDFRNVISPLTSLMHTRLSTNLSRRETEVIRLLQYGFTSREIATQLDISERTVSTHVENIMEKTKTKNRTQVAVWAMRHGYSHLPLAHSDAQKQETLSNSSDRG